MGQVKRSETVNPARNIGRRDAIKQRCGGQTMFFLCIYTLTLQGYGHGLKTSEKYNHYPYYWSMMIFRLQDINYIIPTSRERVSMFF